MANEHDSAEVEHRYHRYTGTRIPWFVHLLWVSFWIFAVWYILRFLFPMIQREFSSPP